MPESPSHHYSRGPASPRLRSGQAAGPGRLKAAPTPALQSRRAYVCLLTIVAAVLAGCTAAATAYQRGGDYLPLAVGNRWELRSRTAPDPMVLEVTGRDGNAYVVRWVNPWIKATFRFFKEGDEVHMSGLDMG